MNVRQALAPALWGGYRLTRLVCPPDRNQFRILLFHDVPDHQRPVFAHLVAGLARAHRLLTPDQAQAMLAGQIWDGGRLPCLISFDDGFVSNYHLARTVLADHGAKALFFVCPGLTDMNADAQSQAIGQAIFDGARPADGLRLMDWDQIAWLHGQGHVIGNHTWGHRRLTALDAAQRADQIGMAADRLKQHLGGCGWFAFTFGDVGSIDAASLAEIARHHHWCRSGIRGANHAGLHPMALRADHVELAGGDAWRLLAMNGGLDRFYAQSRTRLDAMTSHCGHGQAAIMHRASPG